FGFAENTDDLFVGKTLLHGDVLMWLMKTLLTSGCTNQRGAGHRDVSKRKVSVVCNTDPYRLVRAPSNLDGALLCAPGMARSAVTGAVLQLWWLKND
ncbi:hypothetical protein LAW29_24245, partial [Escherichia coli]|nr:hypothetical protein [Escherichia coli]